MPARSLMMANTFAIAMSCGLLFADEEAPKTHAVTAGPFRVVVDLPGVLEAEALSEVRVRPREWSKLVVKKVVPQGSRVIEGEPILWLETDDLDDAIYDAEVAVKLARLSLEGGESELATLEKSVPLDLEAADRTRRQAHEDLEYLVKIGEDLSRRSSERMMRMSKEQLEYAQEELNQLEKMYLADDLTEETEEIILTRQRRDVEHSRFNAEAARLRYERTVETELPRSRIAAENLTIRQDLALERAKATLPASLEQKRLEVAKLTQSRKQAEQKLEKLVADRELLTVKAPAAGVVRYGQSDRGRWTTTATISQQLREGGTIMANQTLFTIVSGDKALIRADIPEAQLHLVTPGKTGVAIPTGYPNTRLPAKLESVELIAVKEGTYDGRVSLGGDPSPLVIGMGATVKLTADANESALSVPAASVFTDEADESVRYVWLSGEKPEKRTVKVGLTKGDRVEILEALKAGDKILAEKPKE